MESAGVVVQVGPHRLTAECAACAAGSLTLTVEHPEDGLSLVRLRLPFTPGRPLAPCILRWTCPAHAVYGYWYPGAGRVRDFPSPWDPGFTAQTHLLAPVACLYDPQGQNRLTFALAGAVDSTVLALRVDAGQGTFLFSVTLPDDAGDGPGTQEHVLRLDTRDLPYHECLRQVERWWSDSYPPAPVLDAARQPMYGTWYGFHQGIRPDAVETQARLARAIGCGAVILDDGWQTPHDGHGFASSGDWQPAHTRIPDMRAFVALLHALDLQCLLWYALPLADPESAVWARCRDLLLYQRPDGTGVLDPRFPVVRSVLIEIVTQALLDWNLDGFKLDFIETMILPPGMPEPPHDARRDYRSVPQAVDRLFADLLPRLRAIRPDVLVEFRQPYTGPALRRYATHLRARDCALDAMENRIRTLDLRLLAGRTPVHADMLAWHAGDRVENAALQLINVLFAVPQISLLLDRLPPDHLEMLRFWLGFRQTHHDVLLDGDLMPLHPDLLYPLVIAATAHKRLLAFYGAMAGRPGSGVPPLLILVNGTPQDQLVLDLEEDAGTRLVQVHDCRGRLVRQEHLSLAAGLQRIAVPPSGVALLEADRC